MNRLLVVTGCCMELAYLSFYATEDSASDMLLFILVNTLCFLLLSFILFRAKKRGSEVLPLIKGKVVWIILGFALLFRFTLVFHPPVGSDDIYRYVWDGKVSSAGLNPFAFAPTDDRLSHLRTDDLPAHVNFPEMRTIYPPLAQLFFHSSFLLFGDSLEGMKFLLVLADIATMLLILWIPGGQTGGVTPFVLPFAVLLYAWSPLSVMYIALDGHIDALGIPFLLLFIGLAMRGRTVLSSLSLGLSVLAKLYPFLLVPFLPKFHGWRKGIMTPLIPVVLLLAGYALYAEPTGGVLESLLAYNTSFEFNGGMYTILKTVIGHGSVARATSTLLFIALMVVVYRRSSSVPETTVLLFLGFLLCSPTAHPWYFTWLAALLPLRWSLSVFVLLGLTNLSNIVVYQYGLTGVWEDSAALIALEYLPFIVLFSRELMRGEWLGGLRS